MEDLELYLDNPLNWAIMVVAILIAIVGVVALITSIVLFVKYLKYNKTMNSAGLTGEQAARKILDKNGLQHIKVSVVGSLMFGNSYSHYFKKVRLRRLTRGKPSLTSLAMGAQKASLAVLAKEGDPDMKKRIKLVPLITFGPFAFIPLIVVGVLVDLFLLKSTNLYCTASLVVLAVLFYVFALVLSLVTLKTEKKAQAKAIEILKAEDMATDKELEDMKALFKLYNVQYINDIILASLELLYYILRLISLFTGNNSSSVSNS